MRDQYLLIDGTYADPSEVSRDARGVLRHRNGIAVALDENGTPQTVVRDAVRNKNVEAAAAGHHDREVKASDEGGPKYKTR